MPIYRCENLGCKENGKVIFLPLIPIPTCQACKGPIVPASKQVTTKVGQPSGPVTQTSHLGSLKAVSPGLKNVFAPTKDELTKKLETKFKDKIVVSSVDENKTQTMNGSVQSLRTKYRFWKSDRSKQSEEVTIEIPIYVHGTSTATAYWTGKGYSSESLLRTGHGNKPGVQVVNLTDDAKKAWSAKINKCWGAAGVIHHSATGPRLITLKFQFNFVDDAADAAAEVICVNCTGEARTVQGVASTIDAIRWGIDDTDLNTRGPICHEVGHLIGNPDEYFNVTFEGQTINWGNGYQVGAQFGIMNNPNNPPLVRNYRYMAKKLVDKFAIPAAEADVILDVSMPSSCPKRNLGLSLWD